MRKNFVLALIGATILAVMSMQVQPAASLAASPPPVALVAPGCPPSTVMERSFQDDQSLVYGWHGDIGDQLDSLKAAGINTIRINLLHVKGSEPVEPRWGTGDGGGEWGLTSHADMPTYDAAINLILQKCFKVEMTLVWYGQSVPQALRAWMQKVAAHFAGRVFRFSILNEPDLTLNDEDACDPRDIQRLVSEGTLKVAQMKVNTFKRLSKNQLKRFKGPRYRKLKWRTSTGKRVTAFKRSKKGKYRQIKKWQSIAVGGTSTYLQDTVSVPTGCLRIRQGLKYRKILQVVVPAIRGVTPPGTQVAAGDTSPTAGILLFIGAATGNSDNKGALPVDVWLHHPYYGNEGGIENCAAVVAAVGLPLGFDEFGYGVNWPDRTSALKRAWQQAAACGVFQMNQYGLNTPFGGTWNTSLLGDTGLLAYIMQP
jgi:hypothetical protein